MKRVLKINKTLIILGVIILISIISFLGLYEKTNGVWKNLLPDYNLGVDLKGYREFHFSLDTSEETKEVYIDDEGNILGYVENSNESSEISLVNEDGEESPAETEEEKNEYKTETRTIKSNEESDITIDNFNLSKQIIQKRLKSLNNLECSIRMDNLTGEIVLEVPDDDTTGIVESLITSKGSFEILDYQTGIILLDNSYIDSSSVLTNSEENGYQLYLQVSLNKDGKNKLSEISKKYVQTTNEAGETTTEYVSVKFEGITLLSTYFGGEITNGILTIPIGTATSDIAEYSEMSEQASRIAYILNEKQLPLKYTLTSDNYIKSTISEKHIFVAKVVASLVILIVSAIIIGRYKLNGLIMSIVSIGYIALTVLLIRYANVIITLNSIYTLIVSVILNYVFVVKLLEKLKEGSLKNAYLQVVKEYYLLIIPAIVITVVFTFTPIVAVNTIGMTLFWGLLTGILYNTLVIWTFKLV